MKKKNPLQKIFSGTQKSLTDFQMKVNNLKKHAEEKPQEKAAPPKLPGSSLKDMQKVVLEVSAGTVAKSTAVVLLLLLLLYFLYQISGILVLLFVSFLFAAALDPIVDFMQKRKIPRSLGVLIIYIVVFCILGFSLSSIIPVVAKQVVDIGKAVADFVQNLTSSATPVSPLARQFKPLFDQIYQAIDIKTAAEQIQSALQVLGAQLLNISFGLMNLVLVLVLTFFMNVEEDALNGFFLSLFPSRYGHYISTRMEAVKEKIGHWLRGQLLLSVVAGAITYIGLWILNVDYALTLSVIAGIFMVIPVMGRIFALLFTLPVVLNQSPILALWVTILYLVLQQVEGNVLVPYIMNKAVGLSPIIMIFAMLVGSQYLGILGLVISIPLATSAAIFVKDYLVKEK
jgi:predicted PurR-regulated permease PerM